VDALRLMGCVAGRTGRPDVAVELIERAIKLAPNVALLHDNLGQAFIAQGLLDRAIDCYRKAIALDPDYANAYANLGAIFKARGQFAEAEGCFRRYLKLNPDHPETYNNLGYVLKHQGKLAEAIECCLEALSRKPDLADVYINLGGLFEDLGDHERAVKAYHNAMRFNPLDGLKIRAATVLPAIPSSLDDMRGSRRRFAENVAALSEQKLVIGDPFAEGCRSNFYLAYQGGNDLPLQKAVANLYLKACPALGYTAAHCLTNRVRQEKIRIGFISAFFDRVHIIGKFAKGLISNLSRERFSVMAFSLQKLSEDVAGALWHEADRAVQLPLQLDEARRKIAEQALDILYYVDIGMAAFTYFLAFARLAPVQCVATGHPVTTGISNIDYFISSALDEPDDADTHYSEQLVRLRRRPIYYYRTEAPQDLPPRRYFGLEDDYRIYLCPMTPYKFHPEFDEFLAGILRADTAGRLVLIESATKMLTGLLLNRLRRSMPDVADRIIVVPQLGPTDFLKLMSLADAVLDTIHFGGGTTSLEAMAIGVPVVTIPGEFVRGRYTYAYYKQMGVMDCVAASREDYVRIAVRLATDADFKEKMRRDILSRSAVLFEDVEAVRELEEFLIGAVQKADTQAGGQATN
jgi:predicted O-linked N-acetylglucosamine transferase (SPINDLY family)